MKGIGKGKKTKITKCVTSMCGPKKIEILENLVYSISQ
jgi:hypothetical protein